MTTTLWLACFSPVVHKYLTSSDDVDDSLTDLNRSDLPEKGQLKVDKIFTGLYGMNFFLSVNTALYIALCGYEAATQH
ncbi:CLUMA_CG015658, isoform A [Clunio marinus]|uniref:CLUMA_CG015658, isoform A n=1 Tax=Clunio marinus TaxID=568069 RepID=A0A1J1IU89_9DIPT|nr:CLUMA_CG015658, isoform A [Clunio marinus]